MVACRDSHLSALWHGDPAYKGFSAILACQSITQPTSNRSHPSVPPGPCHGDPAHNALSGILACQSGHLSTLRHGDPAYKGLSAILACQTGHLSALRHRNPAYKGFSAIPACQSITDRPQTCLTPAFLPVLGTETLPTSASGASSRGHCELVYLIVALLGFVKFTWHEPSLIIK